MRAVSFAVRATRAACTLMKLNIAPPSNDSTTPKTERTEVLKPAKIAMLSAVVPTSFSTPVTEVASGEVRLFERKSAHVSTMPSADDSSSAVMKPGDHSGWNERMMATSPIMTPITTHSGSATSAFKYSRPRAFMFVCCVKRLLSARYAAVIALLTITHAYPNRSASRSCSPATTVPTTTSATATSVGRDADLPKNNTSAASTNTTAVRRTQKNIGRFTTRRP
mmetsp:Transcript_7128/g.25404  ORF Transcript_7128/g.25404 Transcript_7128/m.25404 type:complete len:223 (-) Transcript_7128:643-1311(-)